jgi:hypothetical protein
MKAKEDISAGDLLVEDDGMVRSITKKEFWQREKIVYGVAGQENTAGDEVRVIIRNPDTLCRCEGTNELQ